jgi:hypothetical protein
VIDRGGLTVMVFVTMSTAAVGVCESVTETLNAVEPRAVGVPLIVPPVLIVRPGGSVPDASAQVNGPLPPVEVSVVEYGTLTSAVGSGVGSMTRGRTAMGGLPVEQERANPTKTKQIRRVRALFNPVINVLKAQIVVRRVRMTHNPAQSHKRDQRYFAGRQDNQAVSSSQDYGNWWPMKSNLDQ